MPPASPGSPATTASTSNPADRISLIARSSRAAFERVRNAFWRLVDGATNTELTRANLCSGGPHTGMLVAELHRGHGTWKLQSLGQPIQAAHPLEAVNQIGPYL
ncbi:TerD family protein [Nocardia pseudovaccinii]|uniref:TerD family protein n=1 Tax=Nocardia pseudovaccinii TaxID=189540 RepID=UPI003D8B2767